MIPVVMSMAVHVERTMGRPVVITRECELHQVPSVGDDVEITEDGWSEEVKRVYWNFDGSAVVEFKPHATDSAGEEMLRLFPYLAADDFEALKVAPGWSYR